MRKAGGKNSVKDHKKDLALDDLTNKANNAAANILSEERERNAGDQLILSVQDTLGPASQINKRKKQSSTGHKNPRSNVAPIIITNTVIQEDKRAAITLKQIIIKSEIQKKDAEDKSRQAREEIAAAQILLQQLENELYELKHAQKKAYENAYSFEKLEEKAKALLVAAALASTLDKTKYQQKKTEAAKLAAQADEAEAEAYKAKAKANLKKAEEQLAKHEHAMASKLLNSAIEKETSATKDCELADLKVSAAENILMNAEIDLSLAESSIITAEIDLAEAEQSRDILEQQAHGLSLALDKETENQKNLFHAINSYLNATDKDKNKILDQIFNLTHPITKPKDEATAIETHKIEHEKFKHEFSIPKSVGIKLETMKIDSESKINDLKTKLEINKVELLTANTTVGVRQKRLMSTINKRDNAIENVSQADSNLLTARETAKATLETKHQLTKERITMEEIESAAAEKYEKAKIENTNAQKASHEASSKAIQARLLVNPQGASSLQSQTGITAKTTENHVNNALAHTEKSDNQETTQNMSGFTPAVKPKKAQATHRLGQLSSRSMARLDGNLPKNDDSKIESALNTEMDKDKQDKNPLHKKGRNSPGCG